MYTIDMGSGGMMDVQAILRLCLSNVNSCDVGITDRKEL
jgi:hypothetical protein